MANITPFLWFNQNLKEAVEFYTSVFKDSKVISTSKGPNDSFMSATFELNGQRFMGLNAEPLFEFNEAISFFIDCADQEEVDYYWDKLVEGGEPSQCGWLKDRFGLSWQVVPKALGECLGGSDREGAGRAMQAMLKMQKIIVKELEAAYKGE